MLSVEYEATAGFVEKEYLKYRSPALKPTCQVRRLDPIYSWQPYLSVLQGAAWRHGSSLN